MINIEKEILTQINKNLRKKRVAYPSLLFLHGHTYSKSTDKKP